MKIDLNTYSIVDSSKNIKVHGKFINRELSWISFNNRVLYYALNSKVPINERFNFLGISDNNLNEFIGVRFSYAYHHKSEEPYKAILKQIKKFKHAQRHAFEVISKGIEKTHKFVRVKSLSKKEKDKLYSDYMNNIFPLLTPINLSRDGIYEAINTAQLCVGVLLRTPDEKSQVNVIPIPDCINHIYTIGNKFIFIEDIIQEFLSDSIFINKRIDETCTFKLIRDADISLDHSSGKFMIDRMQDVITKRNQSKPVFLEVSENTPDSSLMFELCGIFDINEDHVYKNSHDIIDYCRFMQPLIKGSNTSYPPFKSVEYANMDNYDSLLDALRDNDILLHHPYDSFETVVKFIEHAAVDPNVMDIRQTLYRVSSVDSPIVDALCKAAENGKRVTVLIELKARFDEQNNIRLVDKLRNSGVYVLASFEYLKTHAKMCIIVRKEDGDRLNIYSHVSTGNYNEKTAKLYTDLSYLTSKRKIGEDLIHIFNILSGNSTPDEKLKKIYYAPINLRKTLEDKIDEEVQAVKKGKRGEIFIKLNSLSDKAMVNKLYYAARKGVQIYIICRGICSIVPCKNLYIKSIVGRFLEHSRIYYFRNSDTYISSADLLSRNLDKRVEILISLKDSNINKQIKWIIDVLKRDRKNSFEMNGNGNYNHMDGSFDSHQWFIDHTDTMKRKKKWKK